MKQYHIAQLNTAHMRAALDTPLMAGFAQQLDAINALAASGFHLENDRRGSE
jgi:hypothetical protein